MKRNFLKFVCLALLMCSLAGAGNLSAQPGAKRVITGRGVFLFGPSLSEADSLPTDEAEALSDFSNYSSQIAIFSKNHGITSEYVSARKIEIRYGAMRRRIVDRDSVQFGTIFTDGKKEPVVFNYVATNDELKEKAKEFFGLK